MKTTIFALCLALLSLLGAGCGPQEARSFYRVSGQEILSPTGDPVVLKGIHFNNGVFQSPQSADDPVLSADHTPDSYRELAELGLDHVRFALNYHLFESDTASGVWKEDGFALIDRNLEWARAAGIKLILQMKWPQGGCQMISDDPANGGKALWQGGPERENQARLVALWTEIARRYANEPDIIGYNLMNEPVVPWLGTAEASTAQAQNLMERIAAGIRSVDPNHILFVEQVTGFFLPDGQGPELLPTDGWYLIDDDNTVYEFHFYEPYPFTHQGADWLPQFPEGVPYPACLGGEETLEEQFLPYTAFGRQAGVPLYVGEWGLHYKSLSRGGGDYIRDMAALLEKHGMGSCYYAYCDDSFALYVRSEATQPARRNEELFRALTQWYGH